MTGHTLYRESPTALTRCLQSIADDGVYATAGQAYLSVRGRTLVDTAYSASGAQYPIDVSTMFNVWCATKPVVAVAFAELLADAGRSIDDPVGDLVRDEFGATEALEFTWRQLLAHRPGFTRPTALEARLAPSGDRLLLVREHMLAMDKTLRPGYSEYASWKVVSIAIRALAGFEPAAYIQAFLQAHQLNELRFDFSIDDLRRDWKSIGCYVQDLPHDPIVLLHDRSAAIACDDRSAFGGFSSARGLGAFYERLVLPAIDAKGRHRGPLHHVTDLIAQGNGSAPWYDSYLDRQVAFSGGFMVLLQTHGFGSRLSSHAVGHAGLTSSSWAFADPVSGVVCAVILNGLHGTSADIEHVRGRLIDSALSDVNDSLSASGAFSHA